MLDEALNYAEMFNRVLPVYELLDDGTCACTPPGQPCGQGKPGKHPRIREWQNRATHDERQVRAWWAEWPNANIGIAVPERTIVFDVDPRHGGDISQLGAFPETVMARSGSGGWHVWFAVPEGVKLRGGEALLGVDIRKHGNYVLVEPSRHASGGQYLWEPGRSLLDTPREHIPEHLLKLVVQPERPTMSSARRRSEPSSHEPTAAETGLDGQNLYWLRRAVARTKDEGQRNAIGFWLATQVRDDGMTQANAERVMRAYSAQVTDFGDHPYTEEEAMKTLASVYSQPPRDPARRIPQGRGGGGSVGGRPVSGASSATPPTNYLREEETQSATPKERDAANSNSFTSFLHSQKTEPAWEERYRQLLEQMRAADELPNDGVVQHPGSNAQRRRRAQYAVLQESWKFLFPEDPLPLQQMSTWLNRAEQGIEGEMVLDMARAVYLAPRDRAISAPRALVSKALLNAVCLEGAPRRQEPTPTERTRRKAARTTSDTTRAEPSERDGDAHRAAEGMTVEEVRKAFLTARLPYDRLLESTPEFANPSVAMKWLNDHIDYMKRRDKETR
ncbi:MAG TPA: bifunctional DNA primase/polymerase [Ktedonobacterales bacterium]|nr:bifunctional DNA primase/polymerase [Ktedonobacterales bacterium]